MVAIFLFLVVLELSPRNSSGLAGGQDLLAFVQHRFEVVREDTAEAERLRAFIFNHFVLFFFRVGVDNPQKK